MQRSELMVRDANGVYIYFRSKIKSQALGPTFTNAYRTFGKVHNMRKPQLISQRHTLFCFQ
jgi:hypothetical protein